MRTDFIGPGLGLFLIAGGASVAFSQPSSPPTPAERARTARSRLAELLLAGPVEGRLIERLPGSYVFVPRALDLPQAPVINPDAVGALAAGPLLRLRGKLDPEGRLRVGSYELSGHTQMGGGSPAAIARHGPGWSRPPSRPPPGESTPLSTMPSSRAPGVGWSAASRVSPHRPA